MAHLRNALPNRKSGMILVLVLVFTGVLILLAATMSGTARSQLNMSRDEADSLRAEMASEAGLEYARRQLALDTAWTGTDADGVLMADGSRFVVALKGASDAGAGMVDAAFAVTGFAGQGVHKFSSVVRIHPAGSGAYPYALLFLGRDFAMSDGAVLGDVMLADRAHRVNDWMFDPFGDGYYAESNGPAVDGVKQLSNAPVDGTVFKYRDDLPNYQLLGNEVLLEENTNMPAWDLDEFNVPGPGKVILTNPHNISSKVWTLNALTYEETVVINLANKQTVTLTNCNFKGGLIVMCPEDYDLRSGSRNLVHLKKGTTIGGGTGGVSPGIGLVAPGGVIKNEANPNVLSGFHLVNEVDSFRNSVVNGQLVILNACRDMSGCTITYDPSVLDTLSSWIGADTRTTGSTQVVSVYEDFD